MKVIYKYQLPVQEKVSIDLPKGATIIRVDDVDGMVYLWAIVDTEAEPEKRHFELYKTGQQISTNLTYLSYLGMCKLFIGMELCLYVFENNKP